MAKHLVIAVDWYGPYASISEANSALQDFEKDGLYLALGKSSNQTVNRPQYVGISTGIQNRLTSGHHTLSKISDKTIWLGEVGTARPSGPALKKTPVTLDYAEWLLAYFLQLPLNSRKTKNIPDVAVTLLNRWWKKDYTTPWIRRAHPEWPDLIDYLGHAYPAKVVWFGRRMLKIKPPFIDSLAVAAQ